MLNATTFHMRADSALPTASASPHTPRYMHPSALALFVALAGPADTARIATDTVPTMEPARLELPATSELAARLDFPAPLRIVQDTTPRRRRKSVEVSEWYNRRLQIHRYGAYSMIPLFALQAYAGTQLYEDG